MFLSCAMCSPDGLQIHGDHDKDNVLKEIKVKEMRNIDSVATKIYQGASGLYS